MKVSRSQLAEMCGITEHSLRVYLARAEFTACETTYKYLYEMNEDQLQHLKELVRNRQGNKKNTYETIMEE